MNHSLEEVLKKQAVPYLRAYSSIHIENTCGRLRKKCIKILLVELHTMAANCEKPGAKQTQSYVQFDPTNKHLI
jgi:hypothetical protein